MSIVYSDPLVRCPFNNNHIVHESGLQRHILRCMKKYPNYLACPYNALHRLINNAALQKHILECPSKDKQYVFYELEEANLLNCNDDTRPPAIKNCREFNVEEEDWDEELRIAQCQAHNTSSGGSSLD